MFQALTLKRPDGIPIPSERTVYRVMEKIGLSHRPKRNPKELRKQTVRLVNRMIFLREISHQKNLLQNA